jgi:hypothetical protein
MKILPLAVASSVGALPSGMWRGTSSLHGGREPPAPAQEPALRKLN